MSDHGIPLPVEPEYNEFLISFTQSIESEMAEIQSHPDYTANDKVTPEILTTAASEWREFDPKIYRPAPMHPQFARCPFCGCPLDARSHFSDEGYNENDWSLKANYERIKCPFCPILMKVVRGQWFWILDTSKVINETEYQRQTGKNLARRLTEATVTEIERTDEGASEGKP